MSLETDAKLLYILLLNVWDMLLSLYVDVNPFCFILHFQLRLGVNSTSKFSIPSIKF